MYCDHNNIILYFTIIIIFTTVIIIIIIITYCNQIKIIITIIVITSTLIHSKQMKTKIIMCLRCCYIRSIQLFHNYKIIYFKIVTKTLSNTALHVVTLE